MRSFVEYRWLKPLAVAAAAVLIAGSAGIAQEREPARDRGNEQDRSAAAAPIEIDAPNARMAALVRAGGEIIMSKGVDSVVRIGPGIYCIKPTRTTGINPRTAVATVSVEYFYSHYNEVTVQWARQGSDCGGDRFGVYTFADVNLDGIYSFSNRVGFVIVVP